VRNVIFIFETSPKKPKDKKVGGTWHIMSPPSEKVGGNVPRVHHQIAPMALRMRKVVVACRISDFPKRYERRGSLWGWLTSS